jgi:hypothetical protein
MRGTLSRATASAALLAAMGAFCAAEDYAPAPPPAPKPAPTLPGQPVFSEAHLLKGAGLASNGLQLKLTADQLALPETPAGYGQPLTVETTTLHLIFTNVSEQPIVLDAFNLALSRVTLIVVGPEKQTVAVTRKPVNFRSREALPIDYPQIEPGNYFIPFVAITPLQFPGDFNPLLNYGLYQPGNYTVQVIYSRPAAGAPEIGVWTGAVVSNTLTFRIVGPAPPTPPMPQEQPPETAPQPAPTPPAPGGSSS